MSPMAGLASIVASLIDGGEGQGVAGDPEKGRPWSIHCSEKGTEANRDHPIGRSNSSNGADHRRWER